MNCLDPALTLACASGYRDPFTLSMLPDDKKKATAAKSELASLYGSYGDQLTIIAAFECWKKALARGKEAQFCSQYFVSRGVMNMLSGMRKQLQHELYINGFIPEDSSRFSENSLNIGVIQAVLVAGLYPRVGILLPPNKKAKRFAIEMANNQKVRLHQQSVTSSINLTEKDVKHVVICYEITRGDAGLNIKNCSIIGPLPLLLLSTEIAVAPIDDKETIDEEGNNEVMSNPENVVRVITDRSFKSTALDAAQIYCLREKLSAAVMFKITHPGKDLPEVLAASVDAIASVLSYDGLGGINESIESVDSIKEKPDSVKEKPVSVLSLGGPRHIRFV